MAYAFGQIDKLKIFVETINTVTVYVGTARNKQLSVRRIDTSRIIIDGNGGCNFTLPVQKPDISVFRRHGQCIAEILQQDDFTVKLMQNRQFPAVCIPVFDRSVRQTVIGVFAARIHDIDVGGQRNFIRSDHETAE